MSPPSRRRPPRRPLHRSETSRLDPSIHSPLASRLASLSHPRSLASKPACRALPSRRREGDPGDLGSGDDRAHRRGSARTHRHPQRPPQRAQAEDASHQGGHPQPAGPPGQGRHLLHTALRPYQRNEKALCLALMEMYIEGVSTRKVKEVTEGLCGTSFSKSLISQLAGSLDSERGGAGGSRQRPTPTCSSMPATRR
jgi:Transposase, Mutator family